MASQKITITISDTAVKKLKVEADMLDISINTYIKQIALNHLNNNKLIFLTSESKVFINNFSQKQSQLLNTLRRIDKEYLKNGKSFPISKIEEYFKSYHKHYKEMIERLSNAD
jgi:hypothetical protein